MNVDLNDSDDDDDNNNGDTGVGNVNAVVDLCWTRVLHAGKDALKPRDNQMLFLACQSRPVELLLLWLGLELGPMASHNTHDKCLIYFALKPHLSCLIACATTLKIYLPHHTPHTAEYKKTDERAREKETKTATTTHTHHKMLSSICVLRSVRHAPNLCAFNCKRPLVTPFFCGSCLSCCCYCCCCCCWCSWHVNVLCLLHRVWPLLIATPQPKLFAIFVLCFVLFSTVGHRSVLCFLFPFFVSVFSWPLTTVKKATPAVTL